MSLICYAPYTHTYILINTRTYSLTYTRVYTCDNDNALGFGVAGSCDFSQVSTNCQTGTLLLHTPITEVAVPNIFYGESGKALDMRYIGKYGILLCATKNTLVTLRNAQM